MCAQVVCEAPMTMTAGAGEGTQMCDSACAPQCDPCQGPPTAYNPCPADHSCTSPCDCGDFSSCCYQQPPRTQPIRPQVNVLRSNAPMETETIYRRSYYANCGDCFRAKPIRPCSNIEGPKAPPETCTIQKLSYLPPCQTARTAPIRPGDNGLRFNGPIYAMTSQKHDYVPKGFCKRSPIRPVSAIVKVSEPLERCTINRLSYMPVDVCQNPPPKPIRQTYNYVRPDGPIDNCTVQKLSYLPVCPLPKEPMPWAAKIRTAPPPYANLCTTYNLSYMPNCNPQPPSPTRPIASIKYLGSDANDGNTVYKLSYMPVDSRCCRPQPIRPIGGLELPKGPVESCTVHKLSYLPNCAARTLPIRPKENYMKASGPIYCMTTQKHDFVPKPTSKRAPIRPISFITRATGEVEKCTINKLSYMPVNVNDFRRPDPIRPQAGVLTAKGPIESCTTYKLSYLPNCPPAKEPMPWANISSYVKPTAPMEKCTIQKLSYGPPGTFSGCAGGCAAKNSAPSNYPTAGICN